ncbi:MAG: VCBS repeat-containing protein [Chloroflexi bacterium]|nr:VCBS repeat-containing protein [Chloroflexota bacterium]
MHRPFLSRVTGILILLSLLLLPSSSTQIALAEPAAGPDDEIIYIDSGGFIRVIDPNVEAGTQEITWSSPDNGWFDFATGDFNNDGDKEIVAIGGGKLTVFDPVLRDSTIVPDNTSNLVPWVRLHERSLPNADIIGAGNLDQNVPGDEIVVGYNVSEPNGINYRVDVLKTADGGRTWTTHISQGFGAKWTYIKVGNINNTGSDDLLMGRTTANDSLVEAHEVDNNFATIFSRGDSTIFTQRDGAIGQVYGGGTGEAVLLRTFNGATDHPVMLIYQFTNGSWQIVEDSNNFEIDDSTHYFPHPFKVVTGDANGNGDDEIFWLRDVPGGDTSIARLVMINRGNDTLPAFETPLDADNGYRTLATGDPDGDGRDELAVMRNNRILVFTAVESGNTSLTRDYSNIGTNSRSLQLANLDGNGYVAGARFSASPTSLSTTLESGTVKTQNLSIQLTNIGSGGSLPISVSKESGSAWFSFSLGANATPASIFVTQFDASNLVPGVYKDRLKITSSNTSVLNQPFYIPIEMTVTAASFSLSSTSFAVAFADSETLTQTQSIAVNGLPGLTFSAAILSQPEFNAAAAALGQNPTQARFAESGALILGNGVDEYTTSISRSTVEARATSVNSWPSAFPWIFASSPSVTVPGNITVAISPTLMTDSVSKGILLVLADDRAGAFPDNLKIVEFVVVKSVASVFLPSIFR